MSSETPPSTSSEGSYSEHPSRITKEDLFMVLALWMETFPVSDKGNKDGRKHRSPHLKVGAVLVLPNDIVYAVDCTRDGVHGVARLLMNHPDIAKGCKVFVSRKPCSLCAKLLVESQVERVFFPPFKPEYHSVLMECTSKVNEKFIKNIFELLKAVEDTEPAKVPSALEKRIRDSVLKQLNSEGKAAEWNNELVESIAETTRKLALEEFEREKSHVDTLFTRSNVAQSVLVPKVDEAVLQRELKKGETDDNKLFHKFWKEEWMKTVKDKLSWAVFDEKMAEKCKQDFEKITKWMTRILVKSGLPVDVDADAEISFQQVDGEGKPEAGEPIKELQCKQFAHLLGMAEFLARRTDDPKTGVGAVIANEKMEIKALGLNGFPSKAGYGAFFRASDSDKEVEEKKYSFVIHAEQNALLKRNDKNLEGGTLFVTRVPCHECVPLIQMKGIKTVVLDKPLETKASTLDYSMFKEKVKEGVFTCYELTKTKDQKLLDTPRKETNKSARKRLSYDSSDESRGKKSSRKNKSKRKQSSKKNRGRGKKK